ncbi:Septin-domain-containing protein [Chytridium lagenaria]|nr:Septin-domain-containing protein [Chytridium lagenaria]
MGDVDLEVGERYSVISTYIPLQSDELYLNVGDVVVVQETFNDGWALAANEKTKEAGLIPTNFVIKYVPNATDRATTATALKRVTSLLYKKAAAKDLSDKQSEVQKKLAALNEGRDSRAKVASNIGSLKVLVVGDSGIGKPRNRRPRPVPPNDGIPAIKELRASTIPSIELHTGEEPFNLTFVDGPGFGTFMDAMMIIRPIIDYHVAQFVKTDKVFARGNVIPNLVKFLNSGTGCHTHVDACIYGILHRLKPVDIEFMRLLSSQVTVIPVIVKSDTLKPSEIFELKLSVLQDLSKANIPVYGFGLTIDEALELAKGEVPGAIPFVVSSPELHPRER